MASLRVVATMVRMTVHIVVGLALVALVLPRRAPPGQRAIVRWWSRRVLRLCRVRVRVVRTRSDAAAATAWADAAIEATVRPEGRGAMLVSNHVSWLDIFVIHAVRPARFVAKAEIARWPLLGFLVSRTGAIFIERGKRHAVRDVNQRAAESMRAGDLVGLFPEGTVGNGERLLPFHANLVQPAIDAGVPIVFAALRYRDARGRPTRAIDYTGDVTLLQSLVRIARHGPLVVDLLLIDAVDGAATTRHEVGRAARAAIGDALGFDDEAHQVAEGLSTVIVVPDDALTRGSVQTGMPPGMWLDPRDELL